MYNFYVYKIAISNKLAIVLCIMYKHITKTVVKSSSSTCTQCNTTQHTYIYI